MTAQPLSAPSEDAPEPRRDSHRVSSNCGSECQPCEDAKYLARELNGLRSALARVEQERDEARKRQNENAYAAVVLAEERSRLLAERDEAQAQIAALTTRAEQAEAERDAARTALAQTEERAFMAGYRSPQTMMGAGGLVPRPVEVAFAAYKAQRARSDAGETQE